MNIIGRHQEKVSSACAAFNVEVLYVFGSVLTERFSPNSDIDFVVSIDSQDPIEYAENYFDLKFRLEQIFNRKIDLLEQKAIKNKTFEQMLDEQKVLVYAKSSQGMA